MQKDNKMNKKFTFVEQNEIEELTITRMSIGGDEKTYGYGLPMMNIKINGKRYIFSESALKKIRNFINSINKWSHISYEDGKKENGSDRN